MCTITCAGPFFYVWTSCPRARRCARGRERKWCFVERSMAGPASFAPACAFSCIAAGCREPTLLLRNDIEILSFRRRNCERAGAIQIRANTPLAPRVDPQTRGTNDVLGTTPCAHRRQKMHRHHWLRCEKSTAISSRPRVPVLRSSRRARFTGRSLCKNAARAVAQRRDVHYFVSAQLVSDRFCTKRGEGTN